MELLQKALFNLPRLASVGGGPPPPPQPAPTATASTANTDVPQKSESKWQETKRVRPPLME